MKSSKQAKSAVLNLLKTFPRQSENELRQIVCNDSVSENHVTRALQKLLKKKRIVESEGCYSLVKEDESGKTDDPTTKLETVPVAELLRRRHREKGGDGVDSETDEKEELDLDDQIHRLEAELAADESDDQSDSAMEDEGGRKVTFGINTVVTIESTGADAPIDGLAVVCLSSVAQERIAPLPSSCLPQNKKRTLKGIDEKVAARPKRQNVSSGLEEAVREVLSGYVARSSEKLPFYCRVCAKQYTSEKEFFDHKERDFHKAAVEMERKASFCKLCRKQFTSPVQLKEHVSSRPHRERLGKMRSRQSSQRINQPVHHGNDGQSQRQWC